MLTTTLSEIASHKPEDGVWEKLLNSLGGRKEYGDNTPLSYSRILEIIYIKDCLWLINRALNKNDADTISRLCAVMFAQDVIQLMGDQRSVDAVRTAHLYVHGEADVRALALSKASASSAIYSATHNTTWLARDAAWATVWPTPGAIRAANSASSARAVDAAVKSASGSDNVRADKASRKAKSDAIVRYINGMCAIFDHYGSEA